MITGFFVESLIGRKYIFCLEPLKGALNLTIIRRCLKHWTLTEL